MIKTWLFLFPSLPQHPHSRTHTLAHTHPPTCTHTLMHAHIHTHTLALLFSQLGLTTYLTKRNLHFGWSKKNGTERKNIVIVCVHTHSVFYTHPPSLSHALSPLWERREMRRQVDWATTMLWFPLCLIALQRCWRLNEEKWKERIMSPFLFLLRFILFPVLIENVDISAEKNIIHVVCSL